MSSNINPNNIDGTYPIAGQDNNSQGFRDNFTQTKVNFQYAASEITDLQNNVVLKSALTDAGGGLWTLTAANTAITAYNVKLIREAA